MAQVRVYAQRHWTDQLLIADGFLSYQPIKRITMARMLPPEESPKIIKTSWDTLTVKAGYWVAYVAGDVVKKTLDNYHPRPIAPHIFNETYVPWDEPQWQPTPTESHLRRLGCQPYYKIAGVWAKQLLTATWVQALESDEPALSPKGAWLCIGSDDEPWSVSQEWFQTRYTLPGHKSATSI